MLLEDIRPLGQRQQFSRSHHSVSAIAFVSLSPETCGGERGPRWIPAYAGGCDRRTLGLGSTCLGASSKPAFSPGGDIASYFSLAPSKHNLERRPGLRTVTLLDLGCA